MYTLITSSWWLVRTLLCKYTFFISPGGTYYQCSTVVPTSNWSMDEKGAKKVVIEGLEDKHQITATFAGTLAGEFLPIQLLYQGKMERVHPHSSFRMGLTFGTPTIIGLANKQPSATLRK